MESFESYLHRLNKQHLRARPSRWLEIQNVRGKDGWLKGEATYIVFDILDLKQFVFFKRRDLLEFVSQFKEETEDKQRRLLDIPTKYNSICSTFCIYTCKNDEESKIRNSVSYHIHRWHFR